MPPPPNKNKKKIYYIPGSEEAEAVFLDIRKMTDPHRVFEEVSNQIKVNKYQGRIVHRSGINNDNITNGNKKIS